MASHRILSGLLMAGLFMLFAPSGWCEERATDSGIGVLTAVQGNVFTARVGLDRPLPGTLHQSLLARDVIETQPRSRAKALLQDDTLLTIGEDSRIEITAYTQNTQQDHRRLIIRLVRGQVRVLVGRMFAGTESLVELQTPTALVASREGYFVVDLNTSDKGVSGVTDMLTAKTEGLTTVVNLGSAGTVSFRSGGQHVVLDPGQRSMAPARGAPTQPVMVLIASDRANAAISKMLQNTDLKDQVPSLSARQAWLANGGDHLLPGRVTSQLAQQSEPSGSGTRNASQVLLITPPAVISGAASVDPAGSSSAPSVAATPSAPANQPLPLPNLGSGTGGSGSIGSVVKGGRKGRD